MAFRAERDNIFINGYVVFMDRGSVAFSVDVNKKSDLYALQYS